MSISNSTILILLVTYLLGTIPTAWIVVRRRGMDIREEGSGNVGAMNTLGVTKSKRRFLVVFAVDFLKGILAVLLARLLAGEASLEIDALAILGVVLGHNFNVWLSLRRRRVEGGKGLAAGLGGLAMSMYWIIPVWGLGFLVGFFLYKAVSGIGKIAPGSTLATLTVPFAAYWFYGTTVSIIMTLVTLAIVAKHVEDMRELLVRSETESSA
jgi:glycerol-3-phosphate acyltransferase PlsY